MSPFHSPKRTFTRHLLRCVPLCLALCLLAGCLLDTSLDAKGGGTMTIKYRLTNEVQLESAKKRLESPRVKLVSAEVAPDKWATFQIQFDDVKALSTVEFFKNATFALAEDGMVRKLEAKFTNKNPSELPDEMVAYLGKDMTFVLHLPGKVVDSNATETAGNTVTWRYELKKFTAMPVVEMRVTYELAQPAGTPASAPSTPAPSKPAQ